jgi:hypothetical protein
MSLETRLRRKAQDEEQVQPPTRHPLVKAEETAAAESWDVGKLDPKSRIQLQRWDEPASVRGYLALAATGIFGATIAWACTQAGGSHWVQAKELLQILLPCETGFLSGAVTFYFAKK